MLAGEPLSGLLEDGGSPANLTLLLSWAVLAARPSESNLSPVHIPALQVRA